MLDGFMKFLERLIGLLVAPGGTFLVLFAMLWFFYRLYRVEPMFAIAMMGNASGAILLAIQHGRSNRDQSAPDPPSTTTVVTLPPPASQTNSTAAQS